MSEHLNLLQVARSIEAFTNISPNKGVNYFILDGPVRHEATITQVAAALFPPVSELGTPWSVMISTTGEGREATEKYHSKILQLEINDRVRAFDFKDNPRIRAMFMKGCSLKGLPFITISFGRYKKTGDELVMLHSITGISPDTALREFQNKSRSKLSILS